MSAVDVVVTFGIAPELQRQMEAVDARVRVRVLSQEERRLFRGGRPLWHGYGEPPPPEGAEAGAEARRGLEEALAQAEVILTPPVLPPNLADWAPRLRWVQLTSAGADRLLESDLPLRVTVTTASGIHAVPIGEYVIGVMTMFAKGWPTLFHSQAARTWQQFIPKELYGKTVGIVGLGNIGREVARLAKALGMRVLAIRRSTTGTPEPAVDEMLPPAELRRLLEKSDYVVIAAPLTKETHHLIGEAELRAMKESAYLINIARGALIDEEALVGALQEGWIAGAGLDVFEQEPLPPESPLWGLDNVIISPHTAGGTEIYVQRAVDLFCQNLRRYLAEEPLLNAVDPRRGY